MRAAGLDVSHLPPVAFGPRTTIWWGVIGLLAIEGTMFAIVLATYFYLRQNFASWPPLGTPPPGLLAGSANMALLLVSVWPMLIAHRAGLEEKRRPIWIALVFCILIGVVSIGLRAFEFGATYCRWYTHAYGSIVWTALSLHLGHLIASTLENILLALLMWRGPVERKHFVDINVNAVYWYFVVFGWLPVYAVLYFAPRVL